MKSVKTVDKLVLMFCGFVAGYMIAALIVARHWGHLP